MRYEVSFCLEAGWIALKPSILHRVMEEEMKNMTLCMARREAGEALHKTILPDTPSAKTKIILASSPIETYLESIEGALAKLPPAAPGKDSVIVGDISLQPRLTEEELRAPSEARRTAFSFLAGHSMALQISPGLVRLYNIAEPTEGFYEFPDLRSCMTTLKEMIGEIDPHFSVGDLSIQFYCKEI